MERLYALAEVAGKLNVKPMIIFTWIQQGNMRAEENSAWFVPKSEIDAYLEHQAKHGGTAFDFFAGRQV